MSNLAKQIEAMLKENNRTDTELSKQLEFLKQAQTAGVIKKPQYNLASKVYLRTSAPV